MSSRYGIPADNEIDDQDLQALSPRNDLFLKEAFDLYDDEKIGEIELLKIVDIMCAILGQHFTQKDVMATLKTILPKQRNISSNHVEGIMISLPSFMQIMIYHSFGNNQAGEEQQLRRVFELFDEDGKGYITVRDLISIVEESSPNEDLSIFHDDINAMINEFAGDGKVSFDLFQQIMRS